MGVVRLIATAALAENIVLAKMLGLCPFIGLSRRFDVAAGVGLATTLVLTCATVIAWCADTWLLGDFKAARPLVLIAAAASLVQSAELLMRTFASRMHRMLGVYLPLIATNCAVLGVMLTAVQTSPDSLLGAFALGLGGGLGFMLAVICLASVRGRMVESLAPEVMRGAPLTMLTAGWMALSFSGLAGVFA